MNKFIKPAFLIMDKLSYQHKFVLMASLFVIPLVLFAGRLAVTFHNSVDQAKEARNGLNYIRSATSLIRSLEEFRDASVISFVESGKDFVVIRDEAKSQSLQQISSLSASPNLIRHTNFLSEIRRDIENYRISPGSEAVKVETLFQNAHSTIEKVYLWRIKLAYEFLSSVEGTSNVTAALDMVNSNNDILTNIGETRALGSFSLGQGFLSSAGIGALDGNYMAYDRLWDNLQLRSGEYSRVLEANAMDTLATLSLHLRENQNLLDDYLLQVIEPTGDAKEFYASTTRVLDAFYEHNIELLNMADSALAAINKETLSQLKLFYLISAATAVIALYLYIGFFTNVRHNISSLVRSATCVANGHYDQDIAISTRDELRLLAEAMNEMRNKLKAREDELTRIGETDGLSQLKNRKFFDEALPITLSSCSRNNVPVCLVMMDIDHFKSINDNYGHQAGDACIQTTAKLFQDRFKRKTDIVARYGGEEFIAILYGTELEEAKTQTEELRMRIANKSVRYGDQTLNLTASFGIAYLPAGSPAEPKELLETCDHNLYQAKKEGRNRVIHSTFLAHSDRDQAVG